MATQKTKQMGFEGKKSDLRGSHIWLAVSRDATLPRARHFWMTDHGVVWILHARFSKLLKSFLKTCDGVLGIWNLLRLFVLLFIRVFCEVLWFCLSFFIWQREVRRKKTLVEDWRGAEKVINLIQFEYGKSFYWCDLIFPYL